MRRRRRRPAVLRDPEDAAARILIAEQRGRVVGSLQMLSGTDAALSDAIRSDYGLEPFEAVAAGERLLVMRRLVVARSHRRSAAAAAIFAEVGRAVRERRVDALFAWCEPQVLAMYETIGFRPYRPPGSGLSTHLVLVCGDVAHLRAVGSPYPDFVLAVDWDRATVEALVELVARDGPVVSEVRDRRPGLTLAESPGHPSVTLVPIEGTLDLVRDGTVVLSRGPGDVVGDHLPVLGPGAGEALVVGVGGARVLALNPVTVAEELALDPMLERLLGGERAAVVA